MTIRKQVSLLAIIIALYVLAAIAYIFIPGGALDMASAFGEGAMGQMAPWQMALGNAGLILLAYVPAGLAGLWLARRAGLPGTYRAGAGPRNWFLRPLAIGVAAGIILVVLDLLARSLGDFAGFPHPPFPASLLASFTAGAGEEIIFRLFVMSLWAVLLGWILKRVFPGRQTGGLSLWLANGIAALAFAAAHFGTGMALLGISTPAELPPLMLSELIVLNVIVGLCAGESFARDGLVAAAGVHFWADVVWHVVYGALG